MLQIDFGWIYELANIVFRKANFRSTHVSLKIEEL